MFEGVSIISGPGHWVCDSQQLSIQGADDVVVYPGTFVFFLRSLLYLVSASSRWVLRCHQPRRTQVLSGSLVEAGPVG